MTFRDIVRLLFTLSFFALPQLTEQVFGIEFEFENEYIVLLSIALFGSFWCGWFCPFGNAQYYAGIIGRKCFPGMQIKIPSRFDRALRLLKYAFLLMFIFVFIRGEYGYFDDHMSMYKSTWYSSLFIAFKKPWAIMVIPLFIPRFFCKYLCYQKAGYQIINRIFPFLVIKREADSCISCSKCSKECPMDVPIADKLKVTGGECVGCFGCVDDSGCPTKPSALHITWFGKKIHPLRLSILIVAFYVIAVAFMIFGMHSIH